MTASVEGLSAVFCRRERRSAHAEFFGVYISSSACRVLLIEDDPEQLAFWSVALRNLTPKNQIHSCVIGR
jgi:hypothetical protein